MATTTKTQIEVKTRVEGYTLTLTKIEAYTLYRVLARTGGNPEKSLRKHVDLIYESLRGEFDHTYDDGALSCDSRIHFTEASIKIAEDFLAGNKD